MMPPDGTAAPFFTSEASVERYATFSPDGQWLAYATPDGIYVRPYPGPEPATQISDAGSAPVWSPDGREIYYVQGGQEGNVLMAVDVTPGNEFQVGRPASLIDPFGGGTGPVRSYDVFPDGSFTSSRQDEAAVPPLERLRATELHVVFNWFTELRERMGGN